MGATIGLLVILLAEISFPFGLYFLAKRGICSFYCAHVGVFHQHDIEDSVVGDALLNTNYGRKLTFEPDALGLK